MKTTRLVIGIVSLVLCIPVFFQSLAVGVVSSLMNSGDIGGSAGIMIAILWMTGGIIAVATHAKNSTASYVAAGFYVIAATNGFTNAGAFSDLYLWSFVSLAFGIVFAVGTLVSERKENYFPTDIRPLIKSTEEFDNVARLILSKVVNGDSSWLEPSGISEQENDDVIEWLIKNNLVSNVGYKRKRNGVLVIYNYDNVKITRDGLVFLEIEKPAG